MSITHTDSRFEEVNLAIQKTIMSTTTDTNNVILPDDTIMEILTRCPAKSLAQNLKYVCKPWCNMISKFNFIQTHFNRAIERDCPSFILTTFCMVNTQLYSSSLNSSSPEEINVEEIENPFKETQLVTEVLGSCNGLLCLYMDYNSLCLLNPCTRELKFLDLGKNLNVDFCAAYGLGYNSVVGEYELVHIDRTEFFDDGYDSQVNIYSLNDDSKATCLMTFNVPYKVITGNISGIYLNGALHWVAVHKDKQEIETIVSFDMGERSFRELLSPNQFIEKATIEVGMLGGSQLCMLCYFPRGDIQVWVMKKYGVLNSWIRQFSFEATVLPLVCHLRSLSLEEKHEEIRYRVIPLYFYESGEILIMDDMDYVFYDPKQKTTRTLDILGLPESPLPRIVTYIPSLVPLKSATNV